MSAVCYRALFAWLLEAMPSPFEAEQLFAHVTGKRRYDLPLAGELPVPEREENLLRTLCRRRAAGEPLQYLLGEWEFYGLPFAVGEGVLIPRADTETLVDAALEQAGQLGQAPLRILDLCSGSGAVAVALAHSLPGAQVTAVELSGQAFGYLRENISRNGVAVQPVQMDLYRYQPPGTLHLITANPPYIPSGEVGALQAEVQHEPVTALDGGADGLDFYRGITARAKDWMEPGGWLLFEIGAGQQGDVAEILTANGLLDVRVCHDLNGICRVVAAKGPGIGNKPEPL